MITSSTSSTYRNHTPPPHLLEKLRKSLIGAEKITMREIYCPYCEFLVDIVGSDVRSGHKMIHCRKCKRDYIISYEHFRTQRHREYRLYEPYRRKRRQIR